MRGPAWPLGKDERMKPYYELDDLTTRRILGLIAKCEESELGNVSFDYYESPKQEAVTFRMAHYRGYWELVVCSNYEGNRDVYCISEGNIKYDYSEKD